MHTSAEDRYFVGGKEPSKSVLTLPDCGNGWPRTHGGLSVCQHIVVSLCGSEVCPLYQVFSCPLCTHLSCLDWSTLCPLCDGAGLILALPEKQGGFTNFMSLKSDARSGEYKVPGH